MYALIQIVALITQIIVVLVIVQFVIGLLFAFNVVNTGNQFLFQVMKKEVSLFRQLLQRARSGYCL